LEMRVQRIAGALMRLFLLSPYKTKS